MEVEIENSYLKLHCYASKTYLKKTKNLLNSVPVKKPQIMI